MAILYSVLKAISSGIVRSVPFYITGVIMVILLIIQCTILVGAIKAKGFAEPVQILLNQQFEGQQGVIGAKDSQVILDTVIEEFPIIGTYMDVADFSGHDISEMSQLMYETMTDYLNMYIWHRVFWIIGIIVIACVIAVCFEKKEYVPISNEDEINIYPEY